MEARRDELHESLRPTPGPVANRSIFLLLVSKRAFGADERETAAMIRFYADALAQEPSWAIERARIRFRDGGWRCPWGGEGWPTEAQVRAECRHETLRIEAELAKIETILGAVPYETGATDSERAGAVAYWEAMKAEIRGEAVIAQRTDAEISAEGAAQKRCDERFRQRERADAAARGRGQAMWGHIRISDELVRQVGLCAPPTDADEDVAFEVGHDRAG